MIGEDNIHCWTEWLDELPVYIRNQYAWILLWLEVFVFATDEEKWAVRLNMFPLEDLERVITLF